MGSYLDWSALSFMVEHYADEIPDVDEFLEDIYTLERHRRNMMKAGA